MGKNLSQTKRAIIAREWRGNNRERKYFNGLLNGYISAKYSDIYNEYTEFFNSLKRCHPKSRDLTKTKTFKKWRKELLSNEESNVLSTQLHDEPFEDRVNVSPQSAVSSTAEDETSPSEDIPHRNHPEPYEDRVNVPPQSAVSSTAEDETSPSEDIPRRNHPEPDILSCVVEEILPENPVNINDVDRIINDIINDLQQDQEIQNILWNEDDELVGPHYEEEDEGIGLNVSTELEAILEPFDYEVEVEGFDF